MLSFIPISSSLMFDLSIVLKKYDAFQNGMGSMRGYNPISLRLYFEIVTCNKFG